MEPILKEINLLDVGKDYLIDVALAADIAIAEWRTGHLYDKYMDPLMTTLQESLEELCQSIQ